MDEPVNMNDEPEADEAPERPDIPEFVRSRSVGEMLAAERRRQGKTLSEVSDSTNIRLRMLQALEDGNWEYLPSQAYVKGYIQNYSTVLGLSPEPFLEAYRLEAPSESADELQDSAAMRGPIVPKRDQAHAIPARVLVGIAAFVVIVGLIWFTLSLVGGGGEEPQPLPPPIEEDEPATESVPETAVPGVAEESVEATPEAETAGPAFEMVIAVEGDGVSWLEVTVDGESAYVGMMPGGESRTFEVTEVATVLVGRPSVVTITRDGEPVPIESSGELPVVELFADE